MRSSLTLKTEPGWDIGIMKIRKHPRMSNIGIGDEVYFLPQHLYAHVIEVFPAAVCVRIGILAITDHMELLLSPQLWRADDIENLSVCRYCGSRDDLCCEVGSVVPFRICERCSVLASNDVSQHGCYS